MKFSFVLSDCDSVVSEADRTRCLESLKAQTYRDFELVLCHDGKRTRPLVFKADFPVTLYNSPERMKEGGDNLRTEGMKLAKGEFIINGNIDNLYYPDFLSRLAVVISDNEQIGVFINPVRMMGMVAEGGIHYDNPRDYTKSHVLKGVPPVVCNIDIMNLVAAKKIYEEIGYWFGRGSTSDGIVYQSICGKYQYVVTDILVGEHY